MNSEWILAIIISVVLKVFTNRETYKIKERGELTISAFRNSQIVFHVVAPHK